MNQRDQLIMDWLASAEALKVAKYLEMVLRRRIAVEVFNKNPDAGDNEDGIATLELGKGYKLKATFATNYTVQHRGTEVRDMLEHLGEAGAGLIKWKPELSVSAYKKLEKDLRNIVDGVIVTKPAATSVEFITPKEQS